GADVGNGGEGRQSKRSPDVVGGTHGVVEKLEKDRQADTEGKRNYQRQRDSKQSLRTDWLARRNRVIDDVDVVWRAGERDVVFFCALQQAVEEVLVRFDLLLDDSIVNGRLVLRERFAALL